MAQNVVDFSGNPSGSGLMDDYLHKDQQNVLTSNSGIQRPSYAVAGTKWLDTSVTPWLWKMYDGTNDITLGTVNPSTHLFIPAGVLPSQSGQSGKFLQTNGSNTVWTDAVDYTNITNCITAIPQDIKLEFNNGTLTLKAGSKVYYLDGSSKIIQQDITIGTASSAPAQRFLWVSGDSGYGDGSIQECYSGNNEAMNAIVNPKTYQTFYNTEQKIAFRGNNTNWEKRNYSLPIALVSNEPNKWTSIDQVFNGFGYIGSTVFALPGVEGLIPNGRNTDGSLNNKKFKTTDVITYTPTTGTYNVLLVLTSNRLHWNSTAEYLQNENRILNRDTNTYVNNGIILGYSKIVSGRITSFNPKTTFHATDYYDLKQLDDSAAKLGEDNTFTGVNTFRQPIECNHIEYKNSQGDFSDVFLTNQTNTTMWAQLRSKRASSSTSEYWMGIGTTINGVAMTYAPTPPTTNNSTQIATTAFVNNFMGHITSTVGSGYVYIGNLLICWGTWVNGINTFPKPFANTNYGLANIGEYSFDTNDNNIKSLTTTGFTGQVRNTSVPTRYIAIGQRG